MVGSLYARRANRYGEWLRRAEFIEVIEVGAALHRFSRTALLVGEDGLEKLARSTVAVFGIGGVGSYTVEGLVRAGVGKLVLVDFDEICITNTNRQIHALSSTVGKPKVEVMKERVLAINPRAEVEAIREFYSAENAGRLLRPDYDYVVDAIDHVTSKLDLIKRAYAMRLPLVSSMGAGNKLDPTRFQVADISKTHTCPLAKVVRTKLREAGITRGVKVVFSTEPPLKTKSLAVDCRTHCVCPNKGEAVWNCTMRRSIPGSISFVPSVAGLILAGVVVNDLLR